MEDNKNTFRPMRRIKQQVSEEECRKILKEEKRCVLSVHGDHGYPYGLPFDFYYNEENHKIYFHCAKVGHKIDALKADPKVSFCTWDKGFQKPGDWVWNVTSVICFGTIRFMEKDSFSKEMCRALGRKYYPNSEDVEVELDKAYDRVQMLELTIAHMTGKLVNES